MVDPCGQDFQRSKINEKWPMVYPCGQVIYHVFILKTNLGRTCTYLFIAYYIHQQCFDHKPTIEEWITFWFHRPVKYHAPMKSYHQCRVPFPTNISLISEVHGWNESHAIFDELGVPKGERTETFLGPFFHVGCACSYF